MGLLNLPNAAGWSELVRFDIPVLWTCLQISAVCLPLLSGTLWKRNIFQVIRHLFDLLFSAPFSFSQCLEPCEVHSLWWCICKCSDFAESEGQFNFDGPVSRISKYLLEENECIHICIHSFCNTNKIWIHFKDKSYTLDWFNGYSVVLWLLFESHYCLCQTENWWPFSTSQRAQFGIWTATIPPTPCSRVHQPVSKTKC